MDKLSKILYLETAEVKLQKVYYWIELFFCHGIIKCFIDYQWPLAPPPPKLPPPPEKPPNDEPPNDELLKPVDLILVFP